MRPPSVLTREVHYEDQDIGDCGSVLETTFGFWALASGFPQGNPFDPVNSFPGNGQILIGQFSTANGTSIQGTMLLQYISNGVTELSVESFPQPCPWDCGGDNDGNVGIVDFIALLANWGGPDPCDFDGGGVSIVDFLELLANWGPCP